MSTLGEAATREPEVRAEGAVLLVVLHGTVEQAEQIRAATGLRGPILADDHGGVHRRLDAGAPTLFVVGQSRCGQWHRSCRVPL
jgi:hypothetical protein